MDVRTAVSGTAPRRQAFFSIDHIHPYANKARATYVMLARASTTSLACAQSHKPLSDARVGSKHDGQLPKRGLQMPGMNTTRSLLGEKYGAALPDIKMLYPPVRSVTNIYNLFFGNNSSQF